MRFRLNSGGKRISTFDFFIVIVLLSVGLSSEVPGMDLPSAVEIKPILVNVTLLPVSLFSFILALLAVTLFICIIVLFFSRKLKRVNSELELKNNVKSEKGIGSEFSFTIPFRPAGSNKFKRSAPEYTVSPADWSSKKCLLVDDNKDVLIYLDRILLDKGYYPCRSMRCISH